MPSPAFLSDCPMNPDLREVVREQRRALKQSLADKLAELARALAPLMDSPDALEQKLCEAIEQFRDAKYMYVLDADGVQLTANVSRDGLDESQRGRDRSLRPYMAGMFGKTDFRLSQAYISRRKHRPSLTAMQKIRDASGKRLGFLGVDYDLRELSMTQGLYQTRPQWQQIKGDPSIRENLFTQTRVQSVMDDHLDDVFALMEELMLEHGVYHGKLHFASNRATVWHVDDPYVYHLLSIEELLDPDICLAFPRRSYFERAIVPQESIMPIFKQFAALRFADETIYLRAGSLNLVNGMVSLNFSCDGTHYLPFDEFMSKGLGFWFGQSGESCKLQS